MNEINKNRYDEVKSILEAPAVPESLSPAAVKSMLDERTAKKQEKKPVQSVLKWTACAAASAVLIGTGSYAAKKLADNAGRPDVVGGCYTVSARSYNDVYDYMKEYCDNYEDYYYSDGILEYAVEEEAIEAETQAAAESESGSYSNSLSLQTTTTATDSSEKDVSQVYNQETGVLEADIVQTDGSFIYSAKSYHSRLTINAVAVEDGIFTDRFYIELSEYLPETVSSGNIRAMYAEGGRLTVVVDTNELDGTTRKRFWRTHVLTFTSSAEHELLGLYSQDGGYLDVRLMEDGIMYLVTSYDWYQMYGGAVECTEECIPAYYSDEEECIAEPEDILLPGTDDDNEIEFDLSSSFTNIGSINILSDAPSESVDFKSLAGFSGQMYCSLSNIYLASLCWSVDDFYDTGSYTTTDFTRISIENGMITPVASASVAGMIKDQFSMSEYNGVFRAAVTREGYTYTDEYGESQYIDDNAVYTFDLHMNKLGEIGGYGEGETTKSVSFQGDLVYVVTFRQTDPLYAIDLSDPYVPVILDEYKITGYSSYMQQWDEGHLLGFGLDADEEGRRLGMKLVMFDNSDPENLTERCVMPIHPEDVYSDSELLGEGSSISSDALSERKALLISPERNLIAVPFDCNIQYSTTHMYDDFYGYALYSYTDGAFSQDAVIYGQRYLLRSVYIDDTIYFIGEGEMIAFDLNTMQETDRIYV